MAAGPGRPKERQWVNANNIYSYEKKNKKSRKGERKTELIIQAALLYTREREKREGEDEKRGRERGESDSVYPQSRPPSSEK